MQWQTGRWQMVWALLSQCSIFQHSMLFSCVVPSEDLKLIIPLWGFSPLHKYLFRFSKSLINIIDCWSWNLPNICIFSRDFQPLAHAVSIFTALRLSLSNSMKCKRSLFFKNILQRAPFFCVCVLHLADIASVFNWKYVHIVSNWTINACLKTKILYSLHLKSLLWADTCVG